MASEICPVADSRTAQWRPGVLPAIQLVSGITPFPAVAWVSLEAPGDAPATTAAVAPDTLPGERPPRWMMAVEASSRLKSWRVPVTTIAIPACVSGRASPVSGAGVSEGGADERGRRRFRDAGRRRLGVRRFPRRTRAGAACPSR